MNLRTVKRTDQPLNPGLALALSGIIIYKGLGILKSLITKLLFLVFSTDILVSFYFSHIYDLLIIAGLTWLIILTLNKKETGPFNQLTSRFFKALGVSFVILLIINLLVTIFGDDYLSDSFGQYIEENEIGFGQTVISQQLLTTSLQTLTSVLFIALFFLSIRKPKRNT